MSSGSSCALPGVLSSLQHMSPCTTRLPMPAKNLEVELVKATRVRGRLMGSSPAEPSDMSLAVSHVRLLTSTAPLELEMSEVDSFHPHGLCSALVMPPMLSCACLQCWVGSALAHLEHLMLIMWLPGATVPIPSIWACRRAAPKRQKI